MRVTLTRRLGQNQEGATVDVSVTEGAWLLRRGYGTEDTSTVDTGEGGTVDVDTEGMAHDTEQDTAQGTEQDTEQGTRQGAQGRDRGTPKRRR